MSERLRVSLEFLSLPLIALVFTVAPGGGATLSALLTIMAIAFFLGLALFGYRLHRENSFALEALTDTQRGVLYSCIGGAFLVFAASQRLFALGGGGVVLWLGLLGLCSYGLYWVWVSSRDYA
jgi:TRAP-type C4-dicarboxylate transport system permease small subunit